MWIILESKKLKSKLLVARGESESDLSDFLKDILGELAVSSLWYKQEGRKGVLHNVHYVSIAQLYRHVRQRGTVTEF